MPLGQLLPGKALLKNILRLFPAYLRVYKKAADWQIENPDEAAEIFSEDTKLPVDISEIHFNG